MNNLRRLVTVAALVAIALSAMLAFSVLHPAATLAQGSTGTTNTQAAIVGDATEHVQAMQVSFAEREAAYQAQIEQVNHHLAERQTIYASQLQELGNRVSQANVQVEALVAQARDIQQQVVQLQAVRAQRQAEFQSQQSQAQQQYAQRAVAINAQLAEAQTRLAEARAMLGQ